MPQLRQDRFTKEWVFVATEYVKHPQDLIVKRAEKRLAAFDPYCPFCPGNEIQTPPEVLRVSSPSKCGWGVRVVPNKFTGLVPDAGPAQTIKRFRRMVEGSGIYEVIVETPDHSLTTALLPEAQVASVLRVSKLRYDELSLDSRIAHATLFKNHGGEAGATLEHSHCQLIATPRISAQVSNRLQEARRRYDEFGKCIFCVVLEEELRVQTRIVMTTDHFVALEPFASTTPFCTHIYPRRHMANFAEISGDEINDLARILRRVLAKLYFGLENPDFKYTLRTAPVREAGMNYYHWYLNIVPCLTPQPSLEMRPGMFINTVLPEKAAEFLREVHVEQAIPA